MATVQKTQASAQRVQSVKSPAARPAATQPPTNEMIAARAYEIWQQNGCPEGCEQEHWLQAERELQQRAAR